MKRPRKMLALAAVLGGATLFQLIPQGCGPLLGTFGASAFDWCAVANCTGGSFFDLCEPIVYFVDCPVVQAANP